MPFPLRASLLHASICIAAIFVCAHSLHANEQPAWWAEKRAVIPGVTADDYAVANLGQLKFIASKAASAMDDKFADFGGAGPIITQTVSGWSPAATDYIGANVGQAKYIAALFYDRLAALNYSGPPLQSGQTYPWSAGNSDDHALINLGQIKYLFSFNIVSDIYSGPDTDGDGMSDAWELLHFGTLNRDGNGDYDGDGLSDLFEFQGRGNPTLAPDSAPADRFNITYDAMGRIDVATAPFTMSFNFDPEGSLLSVQ